MSLLLFFNSSTRALNPLCLFIKKNSSRSIIMTTNHAIEVRQKNILASIWLDKTNRSLQYSKSSRAKCKGPPPCNGSSIDLSVLRYGATIPGEYGETVEWRHWCVPQWPHCSFVRKFTTRLLSMQGLRNATNPWPARFGSAGPRHRL